MEIFQAVNFLKSQITVMRMSKEKLEYAENVMVDAIVIVCCYVAANELKNKTTEVQ